MTAFRPPDAAAREAAADPTRNIVLRASAGTGKTTVLVQRYVALLERGVPPRHVLALTFTRKAAQEMKDRIVARLAEPGRRFPGGRADLAEVNVSTLDAFTLGLVREFPLDAGVSPGMDVLDERSMPVVQEEAIRRVFSGASGFDPRTLQTLPLLLDRAVGGLERAVKTYLERRLVWRRFFEEEARSLADRRPASVPSLREALGPAEAACRELAAAPEVPFGARLALRLEPQPGSRDALDIEALRAFLKNKTGPRGFPKALRPVYQAVKARFDPFRTRWLDHRNDLAFGPMWSVLQAVEAEYQRLKADLGVMDFDDLTIAATRLLARLGEFSDSRFRLEARYHHLLLDEFHDTSDHQWELLKAVLRPWFEGEGLAAEEVRRVTGHRLERPTVFVVGDHKQSIYRFRHARVEILGRAEEAVCDLERAASGKNPRQVLRWNFRSIQKLRRFVNRVSRGVALSEPEASRGADWTFRYDADDELPEEDGPRDQKPPPGIPLALAVAEGDAATARRVAERVRQLVEREGVRPESIALLARATTGLPVHREALEAAGLPTYVLRGHGFFGTSEVRDLEALVRFLARPFSDRRAVELLVSRFFAAPAEALVRTRQAAATPTPFADILGGGDVPASVAGALREPLEAARAAAPEWIALSRRLPPHEAVARILDQTNYRARAAAAAPTPAARLQSSANLARAEEHLAAFGRRGFAGMEGVARALAAASQGDDTQAPVEAAAAVQLLTVHAAKGLEYDHVFLVELNRRGRRDDGIPRVREEGAGRWSIALIQDASPWQTDDGGRGDSEERRCLYVGMTRARRSLTLSWTAKFLKAGGPGKPGGLAAFLPPDLYDLASRSARCSDRRLSWGGETIEVLPPADAEAAVPRAAP